MSSGGGTGEQPIDECPALPTGWRRREVVRKSGLSKGKVDVYYVSPTGKTLRSKVQLIRYLGGSFDLTDFDYQTGKFVSRESRRGLGRHQQRDTASPGGTMRAKPAAGGGSRSGHHHTNRGSKATAIVSTTRGGFDGPLNSPLRQTNGIGRQPVSLVHTTSKDTLPAPIAELNRSTSKLEKPRQLFWAKRLEGYCPMYIKLGQSIDQAVPEPLTLASRLIPVGPNVSDEVAFCSLAAALHNPPPGVPITGQTAPRKLIDANAGVHTNPDQPLIQAVVVSEHDIALQERRVLDARRRLEEALKHFG